jgi:hypothetical protein
MGLRSAIAGTLKSKRFWTWQLGGTIIYGIPATIRFITKSYYIPILSLPGFWVYHFIPGNLVEKFLVNAFFPGGAGGVTGEIFTSNYKSEKTKYKARLGGALIQTAVWSTIQYLGYSLMVIGPFGGNIFEPPYVFPFNFMLASLSIFTPDILGFVRPKLAKARQKLKSKQNPKS